ncbi:hypothetical protein AB0284_10965 [Pseudarthrobacter phenanthrenivorans]|jgi:hypothetical protein|uniref:MetS family NSS transporter small subunit n=1 Tax=Pseudarthrobacter phenanthrenivorans TaxID=361575 RepID=A0A0B4DMM4_PSEPS|nr:MULTISPECIES: hypothetical protein [Micrococcaceae]KIC67941.1 hypothetical protein RM50_06605 [Pseudarthrobacter phenanthrenivorans]MDJ0456692.1 hypothetical protein [Arthrobacter sp. NQ7]
MHPLAAICLVFLTGLAWMGTILTLLVALAKTRRRPPADVRSRKIQGADERESQTSLGAS